MDSLQKDAKKVVDFVLENDAMPPRICSGCEKEFNIHDPRASAGLCKRHMIGMYRDMMGWYPGKASAYQAKIDEIEERPDTDFPPDMAKEGRPILTQHEAVEKICKWCDHSRDPNKSYTLCKRHTIQWARQQGLSPTQIEEIIQGTEAGEGFAPDLGQ